MDTQAKAQEGGKAKSPSRRRTYSIALKREMVEATLGGTESVSVVARRYDVNANQLFRWRRLYRQGLLEEASVPRLLAVSVQSPPTESLADTEFSDGTPLEPGRIEVHFAHGGRLLITGTPCGQTLRTVLEILSA